MFISQHRLAPRDSLRAVWIPSTKIATVGDHHSFEYKPKQIGGVNTPTTQRHAIYYMEVPNYIMMIKDSGKVILLTLLDLSAAFDTMNHDIQNQGLRRD